MKPVRVSISKSAVKKIRRLVKSVWFTEIGGPMVGYVTDDGTLVITDVTGPGPKSSCKMFSVTIDGERSQQFCDQAHTESGGLLDYVGDWHCHPSLSLNPSHGDESAIELMANTEGLTSAPVSLIYSRISHRIKVYVWDKDLRHLEPLKSIRS